MGQAIFFNPEEDVHKPQMFADRCRTASLHVFRWLRCPSCEILHMHKAQVVCGWAVNLLYRSIQPSHHLTPQGVWVSMAALPSTQTPLSDGEPWLTTLCEAG